LTAHINPAQERVVPLRAAHPKSAYVQHSMHFERAKQGMPSAGQRAFVGHPPGFRGPVKA